MNGAARRGRRMLVVVLAAVISSCAQAPVSVAEPREGRAPTTVLRPVESAAPVEPVVLRSEYGAVAIRFVAGALCTVRISVDPGALGDGPPDSLSLIVGPDGIARGTYPAPLVPAGVGRHDITCTDGQGAHGASSTFPVALKELRPTNVTVRITGVDTGAVSPGVASRMDPSLVPLRDAGVARLRSTLEADWRLATRGLGSLTLVAASADVVIELVAARGTSQQLAASDGTTRIVIFVDDGVLTSPEFIVTTALHELGHLWCCYGSGATPDGHWLVSVIDPALDGVDVFGLMTLQVRCRRDGPNVTCPRRFSDRELRELGLTTTTP